MLAWTLLDPKAFNVSLIHARARVCVCVCVCEQNTIMYYWLNYTKYIISFTKNI